MHEVCPVLQEVVDGDTVIIDPDMMPDLDKDLEDFLSKLLEKE